jgi:hypothetical protein
MACLVMACRALASYERAPSPLDGGTDEATADGSLAGQPGRDAASSAPADESDAGGAGGAAPAAAPSSSVPPVDSGNDENTADPCDPDSDSESTVRESCCAAYCEIFLEVCSDLPAVGSYTSPLDCASKCNDSGWPIGTLTQVGSIACRHYHATLAATTSERELHCGHAGEVPMGGC